MLCRPGPQLPTDGLEAALGQRPDENTELPADSFMSLLPLADPVMVARGSC